MFSQIQDFVDLWKTESELTIKVFSNITNEKLKDEVTPNIRSLGRLSWHITQTLTEMPYKAGIVDKDFLDNLPVPSTIEEIISTYKKYSDILVQSLQNKWTDDKLDEIIEIYGQKWERKKILWSLISHQIHHRAQLTTIMRLQNVPVPGIYGPSKEEWVKFGMEPHK